MAGCDWSEIPEDVLVSIAKMLYCLTDYLCAAQACKTWRSIILAPYHHISIPKPPFLLLAEPNPKKVILPEPDQEDEDAVESESESESESEEEVQEDDYNDGDIPAREIVGLNSRAGDRTWELHLPELYGTRCAGSTGNWLIIVNTEQQVKLFNPFTRTQFQLPPQSTLPNQLNLHANFTPAGLRDRFIRKVALSSIPNFLHSNSDGVIAAIVYASTSKLAIAKPGDMSWKTIERTIPAETSVEDIIFFKNRLYFVNRMGMLAFYDGFNCPSGLITATQITDEVKFGKLGMGRSYYLVEWLVELLLVCKIYLEKRRFPYYKTKEFQVFKFDFGSAEWEEVKNLGQHSLFLGFNTSVSLLASLDSSSFRPNCIYFTDDNMREYFGNGTEGGRDMGVYSLNDETLKPHYAEISISMYSPPLWIIPRCLSQAWRVR